MLLLSSIDVALLLEGHQRRESVCWCKGELKMLERETATVAFGWDKVATVGWRCCYRLTGWSFAGTEALLKLCGWRKSSTSAHGGISCWMLQIKPIFRCCSRWTWTAEELLVSYYSRCCGWGGHGTGFFEDKAAAVALIEVTAVLKSGQWWCWGEQYWVVFWGDNLQVFLMQ
jgi:hypothetical protein